MGQLSIHAIGPLYFHLIRELNMRCRSCDSMMYGSPMTLKLEDGTRIENMLCHYCNYISENPDYSDYLNEDNFVSEYIRSPKN